MKFHHRQLWSKNPFCCYDDVHFLTLSIFFQIAVVHYSDEPRIEFRLNDFKDRNSVLRALRALRYGGGNTKTGWWYSHRCAPCFVSVCQLTSVGQEPLLLFPVLKTVAFLTGVTQFCYQKPAHWLLTLVSYEMIFYCAWANWILWERKVVESVRWYKNSYGPRPQIITWLKNLITVLEN